jgi:signal transduction histidine kinase
MNLSNIAKIAERIGHNSIMLNDQFMLKQNIVPLVSGDVDGIKIVNSQNKLVFAFNAAKKGHLNWNYERAVISGESQLYVIIVESNVVRPLSLIGALALLYLFLLIPYSSFEAIQRSNEENSLLANVAKKIAHDIRSPLSTLSLLSERISDEDAKDLQLEVIKQLNNISESVLILKKARFEPKEVIRQKDVEKTQISYWDLLESIRKEYAIKRNLYSRNLSFKIDPILNSLAASKERVLYSIVCNAINNSIEATMQYTGVVEVSAFVEGSMIVIEILDNGKGMPKEILDHLGKKEISFGKENSINSGNGIALFNAKKDLMEIGGDILFFSELGVKTLVKITLPT